jgi:large subunit ribosomal protein L1
MTQKLSKRIKAIKEKVDTAKIYPVAEALELLQSTSKTKFIESVDVAVNLGVDTRKTPVRGSVLLPHGTGKTVRVAAFVQGEHAKAATQAKADIVGFEDLASDIKKGKMDFDVLIATPDAMPVIGKLGQILGPKGLMPNPKVGTVTTNVAEAVKNAKMGQVQYRADKFGIVHCTIGKVNFKLNSLKENLQTLIEALKKAKPHNAKGVYLKKITLSTTMGVGLALDLGSVKI